METGKVAIGHCKYTATDIKSDGNELVGSHILAIKHAAEHDAKHRRGVEQHRGRGHAHLAHALVIKRVSGGEADNAKKRTGNKLFLGLALNSARGPDAFPSRSPPWQPMNAKTGAIKTAPDNRRKAAML